MIQSLKKKIHIRNLGKQCRDALGGNAISRAIEIHKLKYSIMTKDTYLKWVELLSYDELEAWFRNNVSLSLLISEQVWLWDDAQNRFYSNNALKFLNEALLLRVSILYWLYEWVDDLGSVSQYISLDIRSDTYEQWKECLERCKPYMDSDIELYQEISLRLDSLGNAIRNSWK